MKERTEKLVLRFVESLGESSEMPYKAGKKYGSHFQAFPEFENIKLLFFEMHGNVWLRYARESECIRSTSVFFRNLQYKTQVMINNASDIQRTRMVHSLEVAGVAKTCACQLGCNWELAEAIALGHDVGHVPFGHQGEEQLNTCLHKAWAGRFSHALQSVKALNYLEKHTALSDRFGIDGMCLSKPTLLGILKHDTDSLLNNLQSAGFRLQYDGWCGALLSTKEDDEKKGLDIGEVEAQIVYWADKIAYAGHDWEEMAQGRILSEMNDSLTKMIHRMNKIKHRNLTPGKIYPNNTEEKLITDIFTHIETMRTMLHPSDGDAEEIFKTTTANDQKNIEDVMEAFDPKNSPLRELIDLLKTQIDLISKGNEYSYKLQYFSLGEYTQLHDFLEVTASWISITGIYPKQYKIDDVLFILWHYLESISGRSIARALESHLIEESHKKLVTMKDKSDVFNAIEIAMKAKESESSNKLYDGGSLRNLRNMMSRVGYVDKSKTDMLKQMSEIKKSFRKLLQQKMLITMPEEILAALEVTGKFITTYYIGSPRVRIMEVKAHIIIEKLFDFFNGTRKYAPDGISATPPL